ncbi:MAG TPA: DUF4389 domain-containing protein [Dehalococcoidia bacterium]|nr:DUF4389 domain-containing protein [Dehalococcoidia bacterium]
MTTPPPYPVSLDADLSPDLSRWLWLVKWLLAVPHYVVLIFLSIAAFVLTVIAFFAILFTGKYPRGIFDFNVGVLRWCWRVGYYVFIGTDRYPPFSLQEPDYPARLDVPYPERLHRGLALVKWLLAIPHYLILGSFAGMAGVVSVNYGGLGGIGLLLAFFALVTHLFTGRYPTSLFDLVLGIERWGFRVTAYSMLMRDEYPPFRLSP